MATNNYDQLARDILANVGGEENIQIVGHCMTRLRLTIKDKEKVNETAVKALEGVVGVKWAQTQMQIIIGTTVSDLYKIFITLGNFDTGKPIAEPDEEKKEPLTVKNFFPRLIKTMADIMLPNIGAMIAMGMFAAILAIIGPSGFGLAGEDSGVYKILYFGQTGISYFMPILIAYQASKKFNCNHLWAISLIAIMFLPEYMAAIEEGTISVFGLVPSVAQINGQFVPIVLSVWLLSYVEKFFTKILPDALRFSFVGALSLIVMLPISIYIINPLGLWAGNAMAVPVNFLYGICPPVVTFILGATYMLLIMTGMHQVFSMMFFAQFFMTGSEFALLPIMMTLPLLGIATNLGFIVRTKDKSERHLAIDGIIAEVLGGVIEPSLYGLYLPHPRGLIAMCAGMGVTGLLIGIMNVGVYSFPAFNIIGLASILSGGMGNFVRFLIANAAGMAVSFGILAVFGIGEKKDL